MNHRTVERVESFDRSADRYLLMCECAMSECQDMVSVSRADYDRVRSDPRWFMVLPDHVTAAAEDVVEQTDRFWIVERREPAGRAAAEHYNGE